MSDSKAVFLSYASDDAPAAQRVADALRDAGVTVWFDKDELKGGDAWDASIRRQIRDCALFVPIISASTETREEGYFRREWNLAADRTLDMGQNRAFIVPVVIDHTHQKAANVPDKFQSVQWTRLPEGNCSPQFVAHIQRLLGIGAQARPDARPNTPLKSTPANATRRMAAPVYAGLGIAFLAIAYGGWHFTHGNRAETTVAAAVSGQSIAVLPFVDMSEKKDQEYFSDGLTEELIDHLAHSIDLKVIARTSCFQFKGKNEDIRTIAAKLGVANLLEGSVRKEGRSIRVTAQLIRAEDGTHLWSQSYDRPITDIFKVQDEIAETVANALKAVLNPSPSSLGDVANIEAYNALLRGIFLLNKSTEEDNQRGRVAIQEALRLDPNYAKAWVGLAQAFNVAGLVGWMTPKVAYENARNAVNQALKLDPKSAAAHHMLGAIEWNFHFDFQAARLEMRQAMELDPGDVKYRIQDAAFASLALGRPEDALPNFQRLVDRDPLDLKWQDMLVSALIDIGHFAEAERNVRAFLQIQPDASGLQGTLADVLLRQGRLDEALAHAQGVKDEAVRAGALTDIFWALGQKEKANQFLQILKSKYADSKAISIADSYARRGDKDAAFEWLDRAYQNREAALTLMRSDPDLRGLEGDPRYKAFLAKMRLI